MLDLKTLLKQIAALRQRLSRARAELAHRIEALEKRGAGTEPKRASERGAT